MSATRTLSLELHQWSIRPVGQITDESGHTTHFDSWLTLAAALDEICRDGPAEPPAGHGTGDPSVGDTADD